MARSLQSRSGSLNATGLQPVPTFDELVREVLTDQNGRQLNKTPLPAHSALQMMLDPHIQSIMGLRETAEAYSDDLDMQRHAQANLASAALQAEIPVNTLAVLHKRHAEKQEEYFARMLIGMEDVEAKESYGLLKRAREAGQMISQPLMSLLGRRGQRKTSDTQPYVSGMRGQLAGIRPGVDLEQQLLQETQHELDKEVHGHLKRMTEKLDKLEQMQQGMRFSEEHVRQLSEKLTRDTGLQLGKLIEERLQRHKEQLGDQARITAIEVTQEVRQGNSVTQARIGELNKRFDQMDADVAARREQDEAARQEDEMAAQTRDRLMMMVAEKFQTLASKLQQATGDTRELVLTTLQDVKTLIPNLSEKIGGVIRAIEQGQLTQEGNADATKAIITQLRDEVVESLDEVKQQQQYAQAQTLQTLQRNVDIQQGAIVDLSANAARQEQVMQALVAELKDTATQLKNAHKMAVAHEVAFMSPRTTTPVGSPRDGPDAPMRRADLPPSSPLNTLQASMDIAGLLRPRGVTVSAERPDLLRPDETADQALERMLREESARSRRQRPPVPLFSPGENVFQGTSSSSSGAVNPFVSQLHQLQLRTQPGSEREAYAGGNLLALPGVRRRPA